MLSFVSHSLSQIQGSYCYRKIVPDLLAEGHRVLALDFCGCGRSDKPVDAAKITFASHVASISALVSHVNLREKKLTLVIHDWGSLIGQTALPTLGPVLKRLVLLNAFAGPGLFGTTLGALFFSVWQGLSRAVGFCDATASACIRINPSIDIKPTHHLIQQSATT